MAKKEEALVSTNQEVPVRARVGVQKAWKMYVGGQFVRSESGRYRQVKDSAGEHAGKSENVARASRKDGRDAVLAAHAAFSGWSGRSGYNRGQILYRLAEVMEGRADELARELSRSGAGDAKAARAEVEQAIDRVVTFAGWTDKYNALLASSNPVAGPHFNFSVPEPIGVVAAIAPARPSLLGLVTAILPVIVPGNTLVVLASEEDPRTAITFAECLATSDLPGGVVNILTGEAKEVAPHLAKHMEVLALDVWTHDAELAKELDALAVVNVKRVRQHRVEPGAFGDASLQGLRAIERFTELKTIWHPAGI